MTDAVEVAITARIDEFLSSMTEVRYALQGLSSPIRGIRDNLGELAEAFIAAFAVEKIHAFVEKMTEVGVVTQRAMSLLGASAGQVAVLDVAAQEAGGSLDGITHAVERLGMGLARGAAGGEQQTAALKALGVSTKDFLDLDTEGKLALLANRFSRLKDGTDKDAIAIALLGRAGAEMIPIFNQGSAAFEEYAAMVKRAGSEATPEFLAAAKELHSEGIELDQSWKGLGETLLTAFQPALSGVYKTMIDLVQSFNDSVRQGGAMGVVIDALVMGARALATALVVSVGAIQTLWTVVKAAVEAMANDFAILGRIIYDAFTLNTGDMKAAWAELMTANTGITKNAAAEMEKIFTTSVGQLKTIWQSGADAVHKIEQDKTAKLALTNKDALSAALSAEEAKRKAAQVTYQQAAEQANTQYKLSAITEGQKTATLLAALETRHNAELQSIAAEQAIGGLSKTQYQKILNEKLALDQKYVGDRAKILDQAMLEEKKNWETAGNAIQSSFNSQLRGLLAGTTSWGHAVKAMLGDLVIKFIEMVEKWGFEWAAGQLAQLTVQQGTDAAKVASQTAAQAAALPAKVASFMSDLSARAALVFAGVFANLAPFMGPAAAGPAAAAQAVVMAESAAVPKFDTGTDYILRSGLAMVHEGEQITPAQGSGPYTGANAQGGAGGLPPISISAWDGASVQRWLKSGGAEMLLKVLSPTMDRNPSLRPTY